MIIGSQPKAIKRRLAWLKISTYLFASYPVVHFRLKDSVAAGDWVNDQLFVEALEADELDAMKAEFRGADQQTGTVSLAMLRVLNDADDVYARRTFSDYVEALERTEQPRGGLTFQLFDTELKAKDGDAY